jgi:hypothetical protein
MNCHNFLCSHKFHKIANYCSFEVLKKKIWANFQRIIELFTPKTVTKLSKIWIWDPGSEIRDLGSEIRDPAKTYFGSQIPDPGSQKGTGSRIPDLGSRSATLDRGKIALLIFSSEAQIHLGGSLKADISELQKNLVILQHTWLGSLYSTHFLFSQLIERR